jgi:hypothetical protein
LPFEFDRLDDSVDRKVVNERSTRDLKSRPSRLTCGTGDARWLYSIDGLTTALAEDVIPRQDAPALSADAALICGLIAKNTDPPDVSATRMPRKVLEQFHALSLLESQLEISLPI